MTVQRQHCWLTVAYRVKYKLCILMHSIVNGRAPVYLRELVQPASQVDSRPNLCSSDNHLPQTAHSDKIHGTSVQLCSLERTPN